VDALVASSPPDTAWLTGGEPLDHPDLHEALNRLTAHGWRVVIRSTLPGLDDDLPIRAFAPHDVRFHVPFHTVDPRRLAQWSGEDDTLDKLTFALRNLSAFAYPVTLEVSVNRHTIQGLADTVAHLQRQWTATPVHLHIHRGHGVEDPAWQDSVPWDVIGGELLEVQNRDLRRPPRAHLFGMPALALPLEDLERLDLRVQDTADDPLVIPPGYVATHGEPQLDSDALAARRVWLVTPNKERSSWRSHPMDRFADATSVVLIRPGHPVFAIVEPCKPNVPYLVQSPLHGIAIAGRFNNAVLQKRFGHICREVRQNASSAPPDGLSRIRALAHVLRRSLKPKHDDSPPIVREEHTD
jgi:hypothetical protein